MKKRYALLTKNYTKHLRRNMRKCNSGPRGKINVAVNSAKNSSSAGVNNVPRMNKGIQSKECEGYAHIQADSANTKKKQGKAMQATWSE